MTKRIAIVNTRAHAQSWNTRCIAKREEVNCFISSCLNPLMWTSLSPSYFTSLHPTCDSSCHMTHIYLCNSIHTFLPSLDQLFIPTFLQQFSVSSHCACLLLILHSIILPSPPPPMQYQPFQLIIPPLNGSFHVPPHVLTHGLLIPTTKQRPGISALHSCICICISSSSHIP